MSVQDLIVVVVVFFLLVLCSPVLLYGLFKFLPLVYNAVNSVLGNVYGRCFRSIDEWAIYWELPPNERKDWQDAMKRLKKVEREQS